MSIGGKKAKEKRKTVRERHFSGSQDIVYDPDGNKGYARTPRVVPLVANLINNLSKVNAGPLYQALWAADWGDGLIEINGSYRNLLFEAGLDSATRHERSWSERIKVLKEHNFINTAGVGAEENALILLIDPHLTITWLEAQTAYTNRSDWKRWHECFVLKCEKWGVDLESYRDRLRKNQEGQQP